MKKIFTFLFFSGLFSLAFSQALVNNNGADIYLTDGAFMIVKTNSLYNNVNNGQGKIDNQGTIVVEGYVKNDATINGTGDTIRLFGDWINDNIYTTNNSRVDMYGDKQLITGTAITTFNNLNLTGGNVVKQQTINSVTTGTLSLNNTELATDAFEMYVSNPSNTAITRTNGFVSSITGGKLSRATNANSSYLFPVGSPSYQNGPSLFRPVSFVPATAGTNQYGAMVIKGDATSDGYNVQSVDDSLCSVNPIFYHNLFHQTGTDGIALTMYYDPNKDGSWSDQAHWATPVAGLWNYLGPATTGSALSFNTVTVNSVTDFSQTPFALAKKKFTINAGGPYTVIQGQSANLGVTINTTNPIDSIIWNPFSNLSCNDCQNPVATPDVTTTYAVKVTAVGGCSASDSVLVNVLPADLLVPTAFSPNGDGTNEFFHVLNDKNTISKLDLQVFNRWGEKVYESNNINDFGWDGVYKGIKQEMGVYVWQCQYEFTGSTSLKVAKGNVTLVR